MISALKWKDFQYHLITPGANSALNIQAETFRLWNTVWSQTYKELDGQEDLHSDDFSRQSEVGGLFLEDRCVGLSCFRYADLAHPMTRTDSYFYWWPDSALKMLVKEGSKILVTSQISVDPEFRGALADGTKIKYLLAGLHPKMLLESECDAMPLVPRRDRGMHRVAFRYGATLLHGGLNLHGVEVDIAAIYRKQITLSPIDFDLPVHSLWTTRKTYGLEPVRKAA